jgi:hypothetical protein
VAGPVSVARRTLRSHDRYMTRDDLRLPVGVDEELSALLNLDGSAKQYAPVAAALARDAESA